MAVETNLLNLDKKVTEKFAETNTAIKDLATTVNLAVATFVTQAQLTEKLTDVDKEIITLKSDLVSAKKRSALQTWLTGTLSAIFGAILAILIQAYFTR